MTIFSVLPFLAVVTLSQAVLLNNSVSERQFTAHFNVSGPSSTFVVDIYGLSQTDVSVTETVRAAFQILSKEWTSLVPVLTRVTFTDLGGPESLASGGGVLFVRFDRSPDQELLPVAAAEAITSRDLNSDQLGSDRYDVLVKINRITPWHTDIRTNPLEHEYDMVTVLLHEAYHNLLFSGAIAVTYNQNARAPVGTLLDGYPARFDLFLANEKGCAILDYRTDHKLAKRINTSNEELLAQAVTNNRLFFEDQETGFRVPLYSPRDYKSKSSIYHIDGRRGGKGGFMNRFIPSGFVERAVSDEIRKMQIAFLNPANRGARHCSFPLSDPVPNRDTDEAILGVDQSFADQSSSVFRTTGWAVVSACVVIGVAGVLFFYCFSSTILRKLQGLRRNMPFGGAKRFERRFSEMSVSSNRMLIDDGISIENISVDIQDIEIDDDDFVLYEYQAQDRDSAGSFAQ